VTLSGTLWESEATSERRLSSTCSSSGRHSSVNPVSVPSRSRVAYPQDFRLRMTIRIISSCCREDRRKGGKTYYVKLGHTNQKAKSEPAIHPMVKKKECRPPPQIFVCVLRDVILMVVESSSVPQSS
jgi:hypothetical protein